MLFSPFWRLDGSNVLNSELLDWGNNLQHGEPSILGEF